MSLWTRFQNWRERRRLTALLETTQDVTGGPNLGTRFADERDERFYESARVSFPRLRTLEGVVPVKPRSVLYDSITLASRDNYLIMYLGKMYFVQ